MRPIKLIAFDLDGTLLDGNRELSKENINSIKKLSDRGFQIVICTGRPYQGFKRFLVDLDLIGKNNYSITNTGSIIKPNVESEYIKLNALTVEDYSKLINLTKPFKDLQVAFYTDSKLYNDNIIYNEAFIHDQKILKMESGKLKEYNNEPICRINIMGKKEEIDRFENYNYQRLSKEYKLMRNETFSLEILNKNSGKGQGLVTLCKYLKLKRENVMAFGDNINDIEMLDFAGVSVAMGNAKEILKRKSDYLTDSNLNNGVSKFINKYFEL
ncbi:Cof-type HAD-IIB family hydrolase [Anaerococcus faecalis]|nr:Cof-type HAD-IIB family hydrolase [Anaerococcus faecalis]